jgi:hypothetical protein
MERPDGRENAFYFVITGDFQVFFQVICRLSGRDGRHQDNRPGPQTGLVYIQVYRKNPVRKQEQTEDNKNGTLQ